MRQLAEILLSSLKKGDAAAIATIVSRHGSAPRTPGTRMAVFPDGSIAGTIGGGRVEAEVMAAANAVLRKGLAQFMLFDLSNSDAAGMDMICGGRVEVLVEPLAPGEEEILWLEALVALDDRRTEALCLTILEPAVEAPGWYSPVRMAVASEPTGLRIIAGDRPLPEGLGLLAENVAKMRCPVLTACGTGWLVAEPLHAPGVVWIFGAGHISQKLAMLGDFLSLRVAVLDDRAEFANRERFPAAWRIDTPETMDGLLAGLGIRPQDMLVIVTRGHSHDMELLDQALATRAGYIGMIGSRRKRDAVYAQLRQRGWGDEDFARVRCPIGLNIEAETPEEIAISIAAELIEARARTMRPDDTA